MDLLRRFLLLPWAIPILAMPALAAQSGYYAYSSWDQPSRQAAPEKWKGVTKKPESKSAYNYAIPTGFIFRARLSVSVRSFNTDVPAILTVDRDVVYLNRVVIPEGTQVIGTVGVQKSHDRILISAFDLVFPTGDEVRFSGMVLSPDGSAGLAGKVETFNKDSQVASTILKAVVTGTGAVLEAAAPDPITAGVTQGVSQEALKELDNHGQALQATVSITVDEDTPARIYLNQRLEY